ncbi:MAG: DUF2877 domain-containing protein [Candidatus Hadarchaeales archaeon]
MAEEIMATTISSKLLETLARASRGEVHSVFERTFNILIGGSLIGVGRRDVSPGPFNLIVNLPSGKTMKELGIKRGMPVVVENCEIKIGDLIIINTSGARIWRPRTRTEAKPVREIERNWKVGEEVAISEGAGKGFGALIPFIEKIMDGDDAPGIKGIEKIAYQRLSALVGAVLRRDVNELAEQAKRLIGLGGGLTPSGDDALSGFMAALWWLSSSLDVAVDDVKRINNAIATQAQQTMLLSRQILYHASRGEVSERVERLLNALLAGDADDVEREVKEVIKIGETSGADMLLGILLGTKVGLRMIR